MRTATHPRSRSRALLAALTAALLVAVVPAAEGDDTSVRVIVRAATALDDAAAAVQRWGGEVLTELGPFGMVVADVPAPLLDELVADPRTGAVAPDTELEVRSSGFPSHDELQPATATSNAAAAWERGYTGEGVGVVLVDTGIAPHPDLGDRLVAAIDLSEDGDGQDHHGHGTFLAGLVAGDGASSAGTNAGVAPAAHLVSVKVAGADGRTALSTVLQGLVAADRARELYDAPVVLLALSGPVGDAPDPVMIALEMLWSRGSVVVVTAGNDGPEGATVGSPGADPYLITVGALDDAGTSAEHDDEVASWSSRGPNPWGHDKPDLVAPGTSTVGLRAPGSTIDRENPAAQLGEHYFKGTGTSMAAALTAGAAAVLLSAHPGLSPDEVKGRLMGGADPHLGDDPSAMGAGSLDVLGAVDSQAGPANTDLPPLPEPRPHPGRGHGKAHGDAKGRAATPAGWNWSGWNWSGWNWSGWNWSRVGWSGWNWSDEYWAGWNWSGWNWSRAEWSGWNWSREGWSGWNWSGWNWSGWNWSGWNWSGWNWSGWRWTGWSWG